MEGGSKETPGGLLFKCFIFQLHRHIFACENKWQCVAALQVRYKSKLMQNFKLVAVFCDCTGRFVSDLFGNHIVGFPTRRLSYV